VAWLVREYEISKNPIFVWQAIGLCERAGLDYPAAIHRHLRERAEALARLVDDPPQKGTIDRAVAEAYGLRAHGRYNPFRDAGRAGHELRIALAVHRTRLAHPHWKWQAVFEDVAHTHLATCAECSQRRRSLVPTVERCWYSHRSYLLKSPPAGLALMDALVLSLEKLQPVVAALTSVLASHLPPLLKIAPTIGARRRR
jgi:hypothetical protein